MDIFDIKSQMEEAKVRWEKIDELIDDLDKNVASMSDREMVVKLKTLVKFLVEQLRPAYSPEALEKGMQGLLDAFTGGYKNGKQ